MNKQGSFSIIILIIATLFWGSTFAFTKKLVTIYDPFTLVTVRFGLTALLIALFFFTKIIKISRQLDLHLLKWLLIMGIINFLAIILQTVGLKEIAASNSGFLTSLSILFVPVLEFFLRKKKVNFEIKIAILIALPGIYILSYGFFLPRQFILGDLLTLGSAFIYAIYIILIDYLSKKIPSSVIMFYVFVITTIICLPICLLVHPDSFNTRSLSVYLKMDSLFYLLFLVIFGTFIPYLLMGIGQKHLDAQRSAIIYLLEPVFALFIAVFFFNESFLITKIIGGAVIIIAQSLVIRATNRAQLQNMNS